MAKLRPGQPLNAITSRDWNRFVDVADWYERFKRLGDGASPAMNVYGQTAFLVRNNTAGNVDAGAVVEISGTDITDMRRDQMMFNGIVRGGVDPFCGVYLEAVQDGQFGRCVVSGAVIASVNIVDSDNTHARVEIGSTLLKGDFGGWCRILYKPGGTGVKTCVVAVGMATQQRRKARATTTVTDGATGSADVYIDGTSKGNVTVNYNWMTGAGNIVNGSDLLIEYFHDEDKWVVVGAECPP
jgi:hypothetical protein